MIPDKNRGTTHGTREPIHPRSYRSPLLPPHKGRAWHCCSPARLFLGVNNMWHMDVVGYLPSSGQRTQWDRCQTRKKSGSRSRSGGLLMKKESSGRRPFASCESCQTPQATAWSGGRCASNSGDRSIEDSAGAGVTPKSHFVEQVVRFQVWHAGERGIENPLRPRHAISCLTPPLLFLFVWWDISAGDWDRWSSRGGRWLHLLMQRRRNRDSDRKVDLTGEEGKKPWPDWWCNKMRPTLHGLLDSTAAEELPEYLNRVNWLFRNN